MKKIAIVFAALCGWSFFAPASQAQFPNAPRGFGGGLMNRPAVSPYLNLARGGLPAINYYGLVRPQIAAGRAIQTLNDEVNTLESSANQQVLQTGHTSAFMTQSRYFMNNGYSLGGQGAQGGASQGGSQTRSSRSSSASSQTRR